MGREYAPLGPSPGPFIPYACLYNDAVSLLVIIPIHYGDMCNEASLNLYMSIANTIVFFQPYITLYYRFEIGGVKFKIKVKL